MKISSAFPSNYLKAADLDGRTVTVKIDRVELEEVGDDRKPVLYFQGKDKGVVLNKTNANNISAMFGDDTDDWAGMEVQLYSAMVDFQGRSVEAIRIKPRKASKPAPAPKSLEEDLDDNVPF